VLSRVADALYWTYRSLERAENTARFIDANLHMILDSPVSPASEWNPLIAIIGGQLEFSERYSTASQHNVLHFLTFDPDNPTSILSSVRVARENARSVRDVLSSEIYEQINKLYLKLEAANSGNAALESPIDFFTDLRMSGYLIAGVTDNTMSRGEAWHFCQLGRLLERADQTYRLLDVKYFTLLPSPTDVGTPLDEIQWAVLLRSVSAFEMYRKRHGSISPAEVVDFLVLDPDFPHSIFYCLMNCYESLRAISERSDSHVKGSAEEYLSELCQELATDRADDLVLKGLHEFLESLRVKLRHVGDVISDSFFTLHATNDVSTRGDSKQ
jgi:uncharacterized alpha-E superfamily protein